MTLVQTAAGTLPAVASFQRHLAAHNYAPRTIRTHVAGVRDLLAFLIALAMPSNPSAIRREHIEAWLEALQTRTKPATVLARYNAAKLYFTWLREEGEIKRSPMRNLKPPIVPDPETPVLGQSDLTSLLKTCDGTSREDRRDLAILTMFIDTGARLSELANLTLDALTLDGTAAVRVMGKGRKARNLPLGKRAVRALDRYLRSRDEWGVESDLLWLGTRGPFSDSGIYQMLKLRCRQAGIAEIHPHVLRHTFCHLWLSAGGSDTDLMSITGWRTRRMLDRYAAITREDRAHQAHRRISPADRL